MLISVILLVSLDQFTKYLTVININEGTSIPLIKNIFELSYVKNPGAAFGILQDKRWFFIILTTIIVITIIYYYIKLPKSKRYNDMRFTLVLFIAGALGNFIDRIRFGYVVDMLYFKLIDFPVFNVADCYVVVGAFLLIILMLFKYKEEEFGFKNRSTK
jgi:signal peptidase II